MINLSKSDVNFLLGNGPKVIEKKAGYRRQGNGNYTGFVRSFYSDGSTSDFEFVVNAKTKDEVISAYETCGA